MYVWTDVCTYGCTYFNCEIWYIHVYTNIPYFFPKVEYKLYLRLTHAWNSSQTWYMNWKTFHISACYIWHSYELEFTVSTLYWWNISDLTLHQSNPCTRKRCKETAAVSFMAETECVHKGVRGMRKCAFCFMLSGPGQTCCLEMCNYCKGCLL